MRKNLLLFSCLMFLSFGKALGQAAVVSDPVTQKLVTKQIAEQIRTFEQAKENLARIESGVEEAKKQTSFFTEVNEKLRTLKLVSNTAIYQKQTIDRASEAIKYCRESGEFSVNELNMITYNIMSIVDASNRTISLLQSIIEDGLFKMNDAERLEVLQELNRDIATARHDVSRLWTSYMEMARKRKMVKVFSQ